MFTKEQIRLISIEAKKLHELAGIGVIYNSLIWALSECLRAPNHVNQCILAKIYRKYLREREIKGGIPYFKNSLKTGVGARERG